MLLLLNLINEPNRIEVHYWLKDKSHSMDAYIQHKCEGELLIIIKQLSLIYPIEYNIETEPLEEGGLKRLFKIISKEESKKAQITTGLLLALIGGVLVTPITTSISEITKKLIENSFKDKDLAALEKKKLELDIENIKLDIEKKRQSISPEIVIKRRLSNFYSFLNTYDKIERVSVVLKNESNNIVSDEVFVSRGDFKNYILTNDELPSINIEDAVIEIVSPVLKKGNYKWKGLYNGESISFNMKSIEFKELVQSGKVEFKNGSSIKCYLEIERKINNEGIEVHTAYNIIRVDEYFENNKPVETNEGKKHRALKKAKNDQIKISFNPDNPID